MYIDEEKINETEVEVAGDLLNSAWDCVIDKDHEWGLANQMYLKGVHDMAEALRSKYHEE